MPCEYSRNGKLLRHQTPNKLLDCVIQARRRPHSQKADRGDRSEQLQVMEMAGHSAAMVEMVEEMDSAA